jgi:hypothetical protein
MFRSIAPRMFDPLNSEHSLVDALTEEMHMSESPEIIYWRLKKPEEIDALPENINSESYLDDLDKVYGEKSSKEGKLLYKDPVRIYGKIDIQPIINELQRMGLTTIKQIDLYINIAHAHERLEEVPKGGDVFRVTYLIRDTDGELKDKYVYYHIANVTEVDLYNYQYINYQLFAEQTNMMDVADEIKQYFIDNEFKK